MKFEKLNENKIRITLNTHDLEEKNIDFHAFVSQSIESQKLFLDMLDEAEQEIGFITKDYKLMIEALALNGGDFILTVTRITKEEKIKHKKVKIKRKTIKLDSNPLIYAFHSFDDFCSFCSFFINSNLNSYKKKIKRDSLYLYKDTYYLCLSNLDIEKPQKRAFYASITEFGEYVENPEIFDRKLKEYGKTIVANKAIDMCVKHFVEN